MNRNKLFMLAATLARMIAGLATFVLLAHSLGPQSFGHIATAIAYCSFASIVSDYGLATWAQRSASASPDQAGEIVENALASKAMVSAAIAIVGCGIVLVTGAGLLLYLAVFVGTIAAASADIMLVACRVRQRFDLEAKLVVTSGLMWLLIVGGVAWETRSVLASAAAFFVTRFGYLVACALVVTRVVPMAHGQVSLARIRATLKGASTYAVDSILTSLSSQIDVLLFSGALTKANAGIYQAGSRLVQVIVPFAVVLSTVYLTPLTAAFTQGRMADYNRQSRRVTYEFLGLTILGGLALAIAGPLISRTLYGEAYAPLFAMWPAFAIFASIRFLTSGFGIQLVAVGDIKTRIASQLISIAVFVVATTYFLPRYGLSATPWLLASSAIPSLLIYGFAAMRAGGNRPAILTSVMTVAGFSFLIFLTRV